jgi:hypothetical protein
MRTVGISILTIVGTPVIACLLVMGARIGDSEVNKYLARKIMVVEKPKEPPREQEGSDGPRSPIQGKTAKAVPRVAPRASPRASPRVAPKASPRVAPRAVPRAAPRVANPNPCPPQKISRARAEHNARMRKLGL